jgi:hypothetical protein
VGDARARHVEPDLAHGVAEELAILRHVDRFARGGDELDAELLQHALAHQVERAIERGLPTHGRQQSVGTFLLDDARDRAPVDRLDVDRIGELGVGHDGGGIGIDEDDAIAFLAQRLARLGARVVELARLADYDRTGADDQDALDVGALRHSLVRPRSRPLGVATPAP